VDTISLVAWWGAILSTIVLVWDIYKWLTSGPIVKFTAQPNMKTFGMPEREGKTYVSIRATNTGDRPTTILTVAFQSYKSVLHRLFGKPNKCFVVANPGVPHPIPFELKPGTIWDGLVLQDGNVEELAKSSHLTIELFCSHRSRSMKKHVAIR